MRLAEVIQFDALDAGVVFPEQFDARFIAEGDSWFSLNALPMNFFTADNLLNHLRFPGSALIAQMANPGDTIRRMSDWTRNPAFRQALRHGYGPGVDGILVSGGGNDLIDAAPRLLRRFGPGVTEDPLSFIDAGAMQLLRNYLHEGYARIVEWRDAPGSATRDVPIFLHCYDRVVPRDAPAAAGPGTTGPWLLPVLERLGYPDALHRTVAFALVDALAATLIALDAWQSPGGAHALPKVYVYDGRGSLTAADAGARGLSGDWLNEIHPSSSGYERYAGGFSAFIDAHFPGTD
ncbi:MAG: hypothetical protein H6934_07185 [Burkholderiaceae bacterium]|nr:hypothetical protein [Burkholderiaceae bacterium]